MYNIWVITYRARGWEPVPEKLEALVKMPPPKDVTEVRKFPRVRGVLPQIYSKILEFG